MEFDRTLHGMHFWGCMFNSDDISNSMNYKPQDDDVVIATYLKSGTTLVQNMVFLLKSGGVYPDGFHIKDHVPFIELQGTDCLEKLSYPRLIKTHLPFDKLTWNDQARYIFVCRNPLDCCNSLFRHAQMLKMAYQFEGDFDELFQRFMEGRVDYGDYFDHLNSWFNEKQRANILFLTYEHIIKDLTGTVKQVGEFLGGNFLKSTQNPTILRSVVEKCSISAMKAMDHAFAPIPLSGGDTFVRKGVVGDHKTTMSEKQVKKLKDRFREKCTGSKSLELWQDYGIP